jgi:hypothetical protein
MQETQDTAEKPPEPGGVFLGHKDIAAFKSVVTGHEHGAGDGLVREGWLLCEACIDAGGPANLGWSRPSFHIVDGMASTDGKETALRPPPPPPVYKSRREAARG